jgi:2-polyprenyl-3-methyl-5-hydroxy-6-metoxy-1,4-benzoquinol methylase
MSIDVGNDNSASRRASEAKFFDEVARRKTAAQLGPIDPKVIARYRSPGRLWAKELCCKLAGNPAGLRILDVGCGEGEDSLLLASLGARVTGIDISPAAVALARERAQLSGLSGSTDFICSPLEQAPLPDKHFDVIWGDNVLHHVLPVLDESLRLLARVAKPGAKMLFIEPVNLCPPLRKIRFLVPVHTEVTPGERPLERHDLEIVGRHVSQLRRRHFLFLGRLIRFVLRDNSFEKASFPRRALATSIAAIDALVLSVPKIETLGGMSVLYGRAAGARA